MEYHDWIGTKTKPNYLANKIRFHEIVYMQKHTVAYETHVNVVFAELVVNHCSLGVASFVLEAVMSCAARERKDEKEREVKKNRNRARKIPITYGALCEKSRVQL